MHKCQFDYVTDWQHRLLGEKKTIQYVVLGKWKNKELGALLYTAHTNQF